MNDFQMYEEGRKEAQAKQCDISIVRQRALDWWNTLKHYKQNYFASKYHYQERLSVRHEIEKIIDVYRAVHDLN